MSAMSNQEWSSSCGRITLTFRNGDESRAYHTGACDNDVAFLCTAPYMRKQFSRLEPALLASVLKEYGAWDEHELADHEQNLQRLVWLAAGEIHDRDDVA